MICGNNCFDRGILRPSEGNGRRPVLPVGRERVATAKQCAVGGVFARNIFDAIDLVDRTQIDGQVERRSLFVVPRRVPHGFEVAVEELVGALSALAGHRSRGFHALNGPLEGIFHRGEAEIAPRAGAGGIDRAHGKVIGGDGRQIIETRARFAYRGIDLSVELHFVVVGIFHGCPSRCEGVSLDLALLFVELCRFQFAAVGEQAVGRRKLKAFDFDTHRVFAHVGGRYAYQHLGIFDDFAHALLAGAHPTVQIRSSIVEPHVVALFEGLACFHFGEFHRFVRPHLCRDRFGSAGHVDAELRRLVADVAVEVAGRAFGLERQRLLVDRSAELRVGVFAREVSLRTAVVVIFERLGAVLRIDLVDAQVLADLRGIVVGVRHGDDGVGLHQHRQFPEGCIEIVENAAAFIAIAREVVDPRALRQVDPVAAVIAFGIGSRVLVDRRHEECITIHILVLRALAERVVIALFHEHRANDRAPIDGLRCSRVSVGQELTLQFEIPAIERRAFATEGLRIFGVRAPSVHVELHRGESLPLELTHIDGNVFPTENTVEVGSDVGLPRKAGADESRDVEANVFPVTASLVAAPDAGVALSARPPVERDDEGTRVVAIFGHDLAHVGHAVEAEGVAPAHPGHVGFEHPHAGVAHFFDNVALQEGFDAVFGVQIALRPQSDFHAFRTGIVAERLEVLDITVERGGLSVACAVTIVRQEPTERHVVVQIAIDGSTRRELVVFPFAVQAFANAPVVLLAFVVGLAVLHFHEALAVLGLGPIVAVVGIEVPLVETEFRQEHGVAGELIEAVEQGFGAVAHPEEDVEIFLTVTQLHLFRVGGAEVVKSGFEGVPQHAVAFRAPIEGGGRGHSAVDPVVGVLDGDTLSAVGEASVLHAAAVEVLARAAGQFEVRAVVVESAKRRRGDHGIDLVFLVDCEAAVLVVEHHLDLVGGEGAVLVVLLEFKSSHLLAGLFDEDVGRGFRFGVVGGAAGGILVDAENVVAVEVDGDFSVLRVGEFYGVRVDFPCLLDDESHVA